MHGEPPLAIPLTIFMTTPKLSNWGSKWTDFHAGILLKLGPDLNSVALEDQSVKSLSGTIGVVCETH